MDQWRPDLVVHHVLELGGPSAAERAGIPDPIPAVFASAYLAVCPPGLQPAGTAPGTDVIPVPVGG